MANSELGMESIDSGSNYSFGDKMLKPNAPKSLFDLTFLSSLDMYNAGIMYPLCEPIECIMGDDIEISVASLLRVLPQEVPLYSRQRLYVYAFYSRCSDLWVNFNTFMKKGMLGKTIKEIPTLKDVTTNSIRDLTYIDSTHSTAATIEVETGGLADHMGLPIGLKPVSNTWNKKINALPFMMYTRIWRDYFVNKNTLAGNPIIFPDNDDDFRLDDDGRLISAKKYDTNLKHVNLRWGKNGPVSGSGTKFGVYCGIDDSNEEIEKGIGMGLFYHNWPDDRFTDALPWPQRGDEPSINIKTEYTPNSSSPAVLANKMLQAHLYSIDPDQGQRMFDGIKGFPLEYANDGNTYTDLGMLIRSEEETTTTTTNFNKNANTSFGTRVANSGYYIGVDGTETARYLNSLSQKGIDLTLNKIRELAIEQTELEKMARTDGTYLGFAMTFFGERPKNALDYKPVLIGGTYTDLNFTEVLQTGGATEASPLGTYAGHGIAGNSMEQGYIGKIHCDDYGYIMILGCIMPDVYYTQKLDKMWTRKFQSDMYLPERAKMGMTPILNHEIDALHSPSGKTPFDLWAYNNPFDELRYRANEVHGQIADSTKESFFHYTQSRYFDSAPNWGKEFSEAKDIRMDYLAAGTAESAYTAQFKFNIKAVRALPYKPVPAQII